MLIIRPLSPEDSLLEVTELLRRAYARLWAMGLNYTAVDQTADVTAARILGGHCFIAELNGQLSGTVLVREPDTHSECEYFRKSGVATVHQLAVEPRLQGTGIGRRLLDHAETWARKLGFHELAMDTAEQAEHLIAMYAALGYSTVGSVKWPGKVYRSVVLSKIL